MTLAALDARFPGRRAVITGGASGLGLAAAGGLDETPLADWRWILDINVLGVVHSCRAQVPHMAAAGRGLIVNVASAAAFVSAPGMGAYNASKAAVVALSETLHQELAASGVHVAVAMPGFFRTRLMEQARAPADARAAAGEVLLVLPADYRWLWRYKRLAPHSFMRWLGRQRWRQPPQGG